MKLVLFYFSDPKEKRRLDPFLYAYSTDKELIKRFKETRNMKKFLTTSKEVTKDELFEFTHQYPNYQLKKVTFRTKEEGSNIGTTIDVVCTWDEEKNTVLSSENDFFTNFKDKLFDPYMYSDYVKGILYKLGFFTMYNWLYNGLYLNDSDYYPESQCFEDSTFISGDLSNIKSPINGVKISIDQFQVFMMMYGQTMRSKKEK